jgi:hypothetical protein
MRRIPSASGCAEASLCVWAVHGFGFALQPNSMHITYQIEIDPSQRQLFLRMDYILLDFALDLAALSSCVDRSIR